MGALTKTFEKTYPSITSFLTMDFDLIHLARNLVDLIPIPVVRVWVKGHLTLKNRELQHVLNDKADNLAAQHMQVPPPHFKPIKCPCHPPGY